jgi:hypothetical protein
MTSNESVREHIINPAEHLATAAMVLSISELNGLLNRPSGELWRMNQFTRIRGQSIHM